MSNCLTNGQPNQSVSLKYALSIKTGLKGCHLGFRKNSAVLGHATAPLCGTETSLGGEGILTKCCLPTAHLNTLQLICQQFCQKHPHSVLTSLKQWQNGTGKTSGLQSYWLEIAFTQPHASKIVPCPELHPKNSHLEPEIGKILKDPRDAGEKGRCFVCMCEAVLISEIKYNPSKIAELPYYFYLQFT